MKTHWFTLYTDTFFWLNDTFGLVYNTKNKKQFLFSLTNKLLDKSHQLLEIENLYSIELTDNDISDNELNQWIQSLINIEAGYLSHNVAFEKKPVSLKPILKVQDKKEYYELKHNQGKGSVILQNLHELTFYINSSTNGNNEYYKQHLFPIKDCHVLDSSQIFSFIRNSRNPFLCNINIVGNIFSYPNFEKFLIDISTFSIPCTTHIMINDLLDNKEKINEINFIDHIHFNFLIESAFDVSSLKDISFPYSITAFIVSESDFIKFSSLLESFSSTQLIKMIPIYNGENMRFFKSNVFIDKDEIEHIALSKNEIFMRQSINIGNYGKLIIMPNGNVYDNVNVSPMGTINNSPYSLVYKEFIENKSWFRTRDQSPCKDCIYQWLCPSPSNYEIVMGRNNLCNINLNNNISE